MLTKVLSFIVILTNAAYLVPIAPKQADLSTFVIEYTQPGATRYNHIFEHFKDAIKQALVPFYNRVPTSMQNMFTDAENLKKLRQNMPDTIAAMESLADIVDLPLHLVLTVNAMVDTSTWCTSIVARNSDG
jgi:hypothetical protein